MQDANLASSLSPAGAIFGETGVLCRGSEDRVVQLVPLANICGHNKKQNVCQTHTGACRILKGGTDVGNAGNAEKKERVRIMPESKPEPWEYP